MEAPALLDRVCRACMTDAEPPTSLFNHVSAHPDFAHMLHSLTGLQVCNNCLFFHNSQVFFEIVLVSRSLSKPKC